MNNANIHDCSHIHFNGFILGQAQNRYPFTMTSGDEDILAYWYNVGIDSVSLKVFNATLKFHSTLQIYAKPRRILSVWVPGIFEHWRKDLRPGICRQKREG